MAAQKKEKTVLWTPRGRFSYPYFAEVDVGREYSDSAYKTDFLIPKAIFEKDGQRLKDAVLKVGKAFFGSKYDISATSKFGNPFKDTDEVENPPEKGCILIRAKSKPYKSKAGKVMPAIQPKFLSPRKIDPNQPIPPLTAEQISAIKGGDWGLLYVSVFAYPQSGGGVSLGLNAVQFWKEGEGYGQGSGKILESAEEQDVEPDAEDEGTDPETDTDPDSII